MPVSVSDFRANPHQTIETAARAVGRSKARQKVFAEIYRSKRRFKTVTEISRKTGLNNVRVLQEGAKLSANHIVEKDKVDGETAYRKDVTLSVYKDRILCIARDPKLARKYPTAQRPHGSHSTSVTIRIRASGPKPRAITIDDVESFKLVRCFRRPIAGLKLNKIAEKDVKGGLKKIIGETNDFKDWGGEKNDLFTNKFRLRASRIAAAFALKGRATQGTLTPKKMGANGDQVGRLLNSAADVFFVVYHSKVDESIHEQMRAHALGKSMAGRPVYYGVIDGDDLNRLYQAYRASFR